MSGLDSEIRKRPFTEGTDAKEGQVLYLIDPAAFEAALGNAEANLDVARRAADRAMGKIGEQHQGGLDLTCLKKAPRRSILLALEDLLEPP